MITTGDNTRAEGSASAVLDAPVRPNADPLTEGGVENCVLEGLSSRSARVAMRFLPSFADLAFLLPVVFLFSKMNGLRTLLGDCDTGWHIRAGEWMMRHHRVATTDMFSFSMPGQKWYAWEWLWEVGAAGLHQMFGLAGVVWVSVLVLCATAAMVYRLAYKNSGNALVAIGLAGLAMAASAVHWLARPHLVTMLFTVVFLWVIESPRRKLLWLLPVLTVVWTNLHGGFFVGVIMLGAYAGGELVRAALAQDAEERKAAAKASLPYAYTAAGCLLASLVNPYTYHLHEHILEFLTDPWQFKYISEFQGANFRREGAMFYEALLILGACGALWFGRRKRYTEILLLAGWGQLSLLTVRNIPIFALTAGVLLAEPATAWLKALGEAPVAGWVRGAVGTFLEIGEELNPLERMGRFHIVPAAAMALLVLATNAPGMGEKFQAEYDPKVYPKAALPVVNQPGARIFADDEWGDYLIYKLSPAGLKVFVDGRSDFYGNQFDQQYLDTMNVKYDWERVLERYQINTLLLHADAALAGAVKESKHWRVVFDDGHAIVFRPAQAAGDKSVFRAAVPAAADAQRVSTDSSGGMRGGVNR